MKAYKLNEKGLTGVWKSVMKHGTQSVIDNWEKGKWAWFDKAEFEVYDTGSSFEIGRQFSATGNPVCINCPASWFDSEEIED